MKNDNWRRTSRRRFMVGVASALTTSVGRSAGSVQSRPVSPSTRVCLFSKHLQWLGFEEMGEFAAGVGFDGIDLTVRPGGHVLPGDVRDHLPRAVKALRTAGLEVPMITTSITDPEDPETEQVLGSASENGIRYYRLGYYQYSESRRIEATLEDVRGKLAGLARISEKYGLSGDYQNHAGRNYFGASIWDLWEVTRDIDPRWIGCQFDLRHATVESGMNWPVDFRLISGRVHTVVAKDFHWRMDDFRAVAEDRPLGQGVCRFPEFLQLLSKSRFNGPISLHLEYPLGGIESGSRQLSVERQVVLDAMRRDLGVLRKMLSEAGL